MSAQRIRHFRRTPLNNYQWHTLYDRGGIFRSKSRRCLNSAVNVLALESGRNYLARRFQAQTQNRVVGFRAVLVN
jgi:hypothetical protein